MLNEAHLATGMHLDKVFAVPAIYLRNKLSNRKIKKKISLASKPLHFKSNIVIAT